MKCPHCFKDGLPEEETCMEKTDYGQWILKKDRTYYYEAWRRHSLLGSNSYFHIRSCDASCHVSKQCFAQRYLPCLLFKFHNLCS